MVSGSRKKGNASSNLTYPFINFFAIKTLKYFFSISKDFLFDILEVIK